MGDDSAIAAHATEIVFGSGEFRWRLGLRPLDLDNWIEWGASGDWAVAEKARLIAEHGATVFAALPGIDAEASEVGDALTTHLQSWWPDRFGGVELDADLHPLDAAARLIPEDLVLMIERDGQMVFGGGSVCFPNRWDLRSKLGRTMHEVHAPVAELNEQLADPIDRFFERLRPERSFWRLGWGVLDTPDWYTPVDGTGPTPIAAPAPDQMYLRIERETLRRFPLTNAVLFTIRTHVTPLAALSGERDLAADIATALEHMPASVRAYKELVHSAEGLTEYLRSDPAGS